MSRHSKAMLCNVLWHHQGGSSPVGQPIREILGLGQHDGMTDEQLSEAKWIDRLIADAEASKAALYVALPFVEDCEDAPEYKPGYAKKIAAQVRAAIGELR